MANIKSAKKRIEVAKIRTEKNKSIKSGVKTAMKKVFAAIEAGDKAAAQAELANATKGVYHKNNVARKVSRLSKAVNAMA